MYSHSRNYGDNLNNLFFPFLYPNSTLTKPNIKWKVGNIIPNDAIVGIGSVLGAWKGGVICGSGSIDGKPLNGNIPHEVRFVRGPLSREVLLKENIECPEIYGDMALLLPLIMKTKRNIRHRLGIIPHYIDFKLPIVNKLRRMGVHVIDIMNYESFQSFVDEVASCEFILSSSLHGIIVADAYNIQVHHVILSNRVIGGDFKFRDYYASVGREYYTIDLRMERIEDILSQFKDYNKKLDLRKILERIPRMDEGVRKSMLMELNSGVMDYFN